MKKVKIVVLFVVFALFTAVLTGCDPKQSENSSNVEKNSKRFVSIYDKEAVNDEYSHEKILVDRETRVMYLYVYYNTNSGGPIVMVDKDGKPLIYDGNLPDE